MILRLLDPNTDSQLFEESYSWRPKRGKAHAGQMPFNSFLNSSAVMGLFNPEFIAVYVIQEYDKGFFDMHFNAKRRTPREYLVAGGIWITNWLLNEGACEVSGMVISRNTALRRFLEDCGYVVEKEVSFENSPHRWIRYKAVKENSLLTLGQKDTLKQMGQIDPSTTTDSVPLYGF